MNHLVRHRLEACHGARGFGITHAELFPAGSRGHELFTALEARIARIQARAAEHDSDTREIRHMSVSKNVARDALMDLLEAMNRTSRSLALRAPGLEQKFQMPLETPAQDLLKSARSFLANATPLKAEFIREEMPADFLESLSAAISDFENAINEAKRTMGAKVSAHAAQDEDIDEAMSLLRQLDVVVRNKFASNPMLLAEWTSVSHVERHSPRHSASQDDRAPSAPASGSSEPSSGSSSGG